jgi:hypothetical protein
MYFSLCYASGLSVAVRVFYLLFVCRIHLMFTVSATGQCCCTTMFSHIPAGPWRFEAELPKQLMA